MSPTYSTLVVTGTVVIKGTVGLASTHPFRSSRVGAVTDGEVNTILEDNLVLLITGAIQFQLHTVKPLK